MPLVVLGHGWERWRRFRQVHCRVVGDGAGGRRAGPTYSLPSAEAPQGREPGGARRARLSTLSTPSYRHNRDNHRGIDRATLPDIERVCMVVRVDEGGVGPKIRGQAGDHETVRRLTNAPWARWHTPSCRPTDGGSTPGRLRDVDVLRRLMSHASLYSAVHIPLE